MNNRTKAMWILVLTALYALSPIDVFPDPIPFLGNIDDLLVMYFGLEKVITLRQSA